MIVGSAWIGADGIYNFAQALIQLFQILRRRKPGTIVKQWKSYRFCGILIFMMHLTFTGIVFQMVNWNRVEESGEIMIIATAAFAFYKFISAFVDLARDRNHRDGAGSTGFPPLQSYPAEGTGENRPGDLASDRGTDEIKLDDQ